MLIATDSLNEMPCLSPWTMSYGSPKYSHLKFISAGTGSWGLFYKVYMLSDFRNGKEYFMNINWKGVRNYHAISAEGKMRLDGFKYNRDELD